MPLQKVSIPNISKNDQSYFVLSFSVIHIYYVCYHSGYCAIRQQLENSSHENAKTEGLAKLMSDGQVIAFILTLKVITSYY